MYHKEAFCANKHGQVGAASDTVIITSFSVFRFLEKLRKVRKKQLLPDCAIVTEENLPTAECLLG